VWTGLAVPACVQARDGLVFHEAGDIFLHGKQELFLEGATGMDEAREHEADVLSRDHLIPPRAWKRFVERADFSLQTVQDFADEIDIAPGIVVGRLQYEGLFPHARGNRLKVYYRWS